MTTVRTRTTTKVKRVDGIGHVEASTFDDSQRRFKQKDHGIFSQYSGMEKQTKASKKKKKTKTFKERQQEKLAASNEKMEQRKEEKRLKERQSEKKHTQQPPRIPSTQRRKLLEKTTIKTNPVAQPPRIPSSKRVKLLKKKKKHKESELCTLMGKVKGRKKPATDGSRTETLQNTIKTKLKPSASFVKIEPSSTSMPFQIGEKVCILTGQRAGELANVMGFSDRTEMVELVLEKSKSKYFRPVSALSTDVNMKHTPGSLPRRRNEIQSTNLSMQILSNVSKM